MHRDPYASSEGGESFRVVERVGLEIDGTLVTLTGPAFDHYPLTGELSAARLQRSVRARCVEHLVVVGAHADRLQLSTGAPGEAGAMVADVVWFRTLDVCTASLEALVARAHADDDDGCMSFASRVVLRSHVLASADAR